ncbi:MAG: VCBS repeat-containing protein [Lewinellaceae bacterium]|nr:VCBS repeat-containing protein [Lewinellaceae bacterium]
MKLIAYHLFPLLVLTMPLSAQSVGNGTPCQTKVLPTDFGIKIDWISGTEDASDLATPMVGNLNPWEDSIPEIVIPHYSTSNFSTELLIYRGDGVNLSNPARLNLPEGIQTVMGVHPMLADLDADGNPELTLVCNDGYIRVFHNYNPAANPVMDLWITSDVPCDSTSNHAYAADFDGDGVAEIYAGNEIFRLDPSVPSLSRVLKGNGPKGLLNSQVSFSTTHLFSSSLAADLLSPADCNGDPDCNGMELACGNVIYSIDLDPNDGDGFQIKIQRNLNTMSGENFGDGFTAVADINLDGTEEVLVAGMLNGKRGIYAWNKTGFWAFFPSTGSVAFGNDWTISTITVANVYDDTQNGWASDWPEILCSNVGYLNCFNLHKANSTPATPYWWRLSNDSPGAYNAGVSAFDFDNNGLDEIVYQDGNALRILYGGNAPFPTGVDAQRNWASLDAGSYPAFEYPAVADVDSDKPMNLSMAPGCRQEKYGTSTITMAYTLTTT